MVEVLLKKPIGERSLLLLAVLLLFSLDISQN